MENFVENIGNYTCSWEQDNDLSAENAEACACSQNGCTGHPYSTNITSSHWGAGIYFKKIVSHIRNVTHDSRLGHSDSNQRIKRRESEGASYRFSFSIIIWRFNWMRKNFRSFYSWCTLNINMCKTKGCLDTKLLGKETRTTSCHRMRILVLSECFQQC